jgi:hypothetical protein
MDLMINQYTVSLAFDNWQPRIKKVWQTMGLSANYLNGVAAFIKKDKATLLPFGLIITSPSSIRFQITSS